MAVALDVTSTPVNNITVSNPATSGTLGTFTCASGSVLIVTSFWEDSNSGVKPTITGITDNSGASNAWQKYKRYTRAFTNGYGGAHNDVEEIWWTVSTSSWSGKTVTVSYDSSGDDCIISLTAFSGCNTSSPFDANASLGTQQFYDSATAGTQLFSAISTNQSAGMLVAVQGTSVLLSTGVNYANSGWTQIPATTIIVNSGGNWAASGALYYQSFSSVIASQSYTPCTEPLSEWYSILFALVPPGAGPSVPPWGWENQSVQLQGYKTYNLRTPAPGAIIRGDDGIEAPFIRFRPYGWEIAPPPPPHTFREKRGNILKGDDGTEGKFINFHPYGWEIQPPQLQSWLTYNLRTPTAGALSQREDGIEAPYVFVPSGQTITWGFEQANPPPFFRTKQVTPFKGDDGIEKQFILFNPYGWEIQPPQSQSYTTYNLRTPTAGALSQREDGIEGPFINWKNYGWDIQPPQPPFPITKSRGSTLKGIDGIEGVYYLWYNTGWEIQPPQPPHPFLEKRGNILKGDEGNQSPYINFKPYGWEIQPPQPPHQFYEKKGGILRGIDGIEGNFINFFPFGWEIQPPQPPNYPKTGQKTGSWSHPEEGIEAPYIFIAPGQVFWGYDGPLIYPKKLIKHLDPPLNIDAQYINFKPYGWELQSYQPQHTFIRIPSILRGDDGNQAQFINFLPYGWEIQPPQPPNYPTTRQKTGNWSHLEEGIEAPFIFVSPTPTVWGYDGPLIYPKKLFKWFEPAGNIDAPFINFFPAGWEVQPYQPPHRQPEIKAASFLKGDDGTEGVFINWKNYGWDIQPPQPPNYPKTNQRTGSWSQWEDGIEAPYIFVPFGFTAWAFDPQPVQPPYHINRLQAFLRGDDGIEAPFVHWYNFGWEIPPPPPPHTFIEKRGLILRGDDGTEGIFIRFYPYGWEVAPYQPPHRQPENKAATFLQGDQGTQQVLIRFFPGGWVIQPVQPPHPEPEIAGAIMVGDQGTQGIYNFVPPPPVVLKPGWLIRARHTGRR